MNFPFHLKNQILQDNIDLSALDETDLREWLVSNFVNILCDQKIFIGSVSLTPLKNPNYTFLYKIEAFGDQKVYDIEYGELKSLHIDEEELIENKSNRLSILNIEKTLDIIPVLECLDSLDFIFLKTTHRKTLIIY
jgi:hypothetical protein